jgi:hypothetical protein
MQTRFLAAATGALLLSIAPTPANAQVQQAQPQPDMLQQFLGAMFGTTPQASEQTLDNDWNQGRRPFAQRRAQLDTRIDAAVRDGSMSRNEADQIRREYDDIVRVEAQYAADGNVSTQQRADLRTRYRTLVQRVDAQGYAGAADGRWLPVASRNAEFERAVDDDLRNRRLTQAQATQLRSDWRALAQTEANYQRGGLDSREQTDLWARYNAIDRRLGGSLSSSSDFGRDPARWTQLETRLATAERNGRITRSEATQLRATLGDLARLDTAYANGGYNSDQRAYLQRRYAELDGMMGTTYRR